MWALPIDQSHHSRTTNCLFQPLTPHGNLKSAGFATVKIWFRLPVMAGSHCKYELLTVILA